MKASDGFVKTIEKYLQHRVENDELFAARYNNPDKSIEKCCDYILSTVHKSGNNGFADDEIYGMALHYYMEDKIDMGVPASGMRVVVNHVVELSEDEKQSAKDKAMEQATKQQLAAITKKPASKPKAAISQQPSLFDDL